MKITMLYRGPLSSCNYSCVYCPFAKHRETAREHAEDAAALIRFVNWVTERTEHRLSIFFTPWGEALNRKRYQNALIRLTNIRHVDKVAIQTNLSCRLDWLDHCNKERLGLWITFHPSQITRRRFVAKCAELIRRDVRFSVGVVGLPEYRSEIELLRNELPPDIYLWINAYKDVCNYYRKEDMQLYKRVDPLFPINNHHHSSRGELCRCGQSVISVNGDGTIRRCHFIEQPIGNIYQPGFENCLRERRCPNLTCGCHIGYVHLDKLKLYEIFGDGVLERIPTDPHWQEKAESIVAAIDQ
ncbi:MAG: STM4011 family radical SAM protein [Acidobacteriota bacterium]